MTDTADNTLTLTRTLDAPRAALWRCWTEGPLLEQWFCPKPWFVTQAKLDLRPGGAFCCIMNGPDGEQFPNEGVFLEIVAQEKIITTDAFKPGWILSERAFMSAEMTFEDAGRGKTLYTAKARHWTAEAAAEHEAMGFHDGWGKATDQLEALARSL